MVGMMGVGRFDVDEDRVADIDQIIGGISGEDLPAMGSGPSRCRIGRRDELGTTSVAASKAPSSSTAVYSWTARPVAPGGSFFSPSIFLPVGMRLDQTGIDRKGFPADQSLADTALQVSKTRRRRSLSRKRPCRFFEKVE